jgi:hypothetical protein
LDDQFLLKTAFIENGNHEKLDFVDDGVAVIHYLSSFDNGKEEGRTYPDFDFT